MCSPGHGRQAEPITARARGAVVTRKALQAGSKWTASPERQGAAMTAIRNREEGAMAISFPVPESAIDHEIELGGDEPSRASWLFDALGEALRRGCQRVASAIFDPDGDCMRL